MRRIKTIEDAQKAINEILDWKDTLSSKNIDLKGRRVVNAGRSIDLTDYVTKQELQDTIQQFKQDDPTYTMVFSNDTVDDGYIFPEYVAGRNRDGYPHDCWVKCIGMPTEGSLIVRFYINGIQLLTDDLELTAGSVKQVHSSGFVVPTPKVGFSSIGRCEVIQSGGATGVSAGIVIDRIK